MNEITRQACIVAMGAAVLHSASVRGTVVENSTGYPIARAEITAQSVAGDLQPQKVRTNPSGIFEFTALPAGAYRVSATKLGFAPVEYGQKRWYSPGMPISLAADDAADLAIRMPRFGAISGAVLDENDVGLAEYEVAVYSNTHPPRLLAHAPTDDRGVYRLAGLRPGTYLIRSLAKDYDDESYLPTFYRDSPTLDQAHAIEVKLDEEVEQMDFHASTGRLYTLSGRVNKGAGQQAVVTLTSDMGTETASIDGRGRFTFRAMPPGQYDLLAVVTSDRLHERWAAFQTVTVDRDIGDQFLSVASLPLVQFAFADTSGRPLAMPGASIMVRRKDASGVGSVETLNLSTDPTLLPGRWEVALPPGPAYSVKAVEPRESGDRADGWNEILLRPGSRDVVKFVLSLFPAAIAGTVKNANGDPVSGMPVFLEPYDLDPRQRLEPMRSTTTDEKGHYQIAGLAAGVYRLLASFDFQNPDSAQMEAANAKTVRVEEGAHIALDLEEFVIR